ncbi:hypothetical protein VP504_10475 [Grimontia sp. NTOU-MAR1]|nr:hypothetical protein VP504_10475 [Grimontia sp. NTOU-MAR1]
MVKSKDQTLKATISNNAANPHQYWHHRNFVMTEEFQNGRHDAQGNDM